MVTVTENGDSPTGTFKVNFEFAGGVSAEFTETHSQSTNGDATPENRGVVTKQFTDTVAVEGFVFAYIQLDDEKKPHDEKDFEFFAPNSDNITSS